MTEEATLHNPLGSYHRQNNQRVRFLYENSIGGLIITLILVSVVVAMAWVELTLQDRHAYLLYWYLAYTGVTFARIGLVQTYLKQGRNDPYRHRYWRHWFHTGVAVSGFLLGLGAVSLLPWVSLPLQMLIHLLVVGIAAGAIPFLGTYLQVFMTYVSLMLVPMIAYLVWQGDVFNFVFAGLYLFKLVTAWSNVKRMNGLLRESLYLRFDNEVLNNELESLVGAVAQSNRALEKLSNTDDLTGLANHRHLRMNLKNLWLRYREQSLPISLALINIDHFKEYVEREGSAAGDRCLQKVAGMLQQYLQNNDEHLARLNGAEFGLLVPLFSADQLQERLQKIMKDIEAENIVHPNSAVAPRISFSIGIASEYCSSLKDPFELFQRADTALQQAKDNGRNRIEITFRSASAA